MALEHRRRRFPTTRWSVVVAAGDSVSPESQAALSALCEAYWAPVYAYVCRTGRSEDVARDLTQAFFTRVLEKRDFRNARSDLGRFRSFLLTAVRYFLANQVDYERSLKRGGGQIHLPLEPVAGGPCQAPADRSSGETPETIYEQRWAQTVLDQAMAKLAQESERAGRGRLFEGLRPFLTGDAEASYASCAQELGMTEGAVRVALHRLRGQFGRHLRQTLAETVSDPGEIDSEIQYLLRVLARRHASSSLEQV